MRLKRPGLATEHLTTPAAEVCVRGVRATNAPPIVTYCLLNPYIKKWQSMIFDLLRRDRKTAKNER